jgi:hypothetical protein
VSGRLAIAIPAWQPSETLLHVVRALSEKGAAAILVVDDGSGSEYQDVFARVGATPGVEVLRHAVKRGSGSAFETAVNHALCTISGLGGVVAAPDGASAEDILLVMESLREHPEAMILGPVP